MSVDDADLPLEVESTPEEMIAMGISTCNINGVDIPVESPGAAMCRTSHRTPLMVHARGGSGMSDVRLADGFLVGTVDSQPSVPPTMALIDPVAEGALLGEAGAFLAALEMVGGTEHTLTSLAELADVAPTARLEAVQAERAWSEETSAADAAWLEALEAAIAETGGTINESASEPPVMPVVVSPQREGALTVRVTVEGGFPEPRVESSGRHSFVQMPSEVFGEQPGEMVHQTSADVSLLLDPFSSAGVVLPLLGEDAPPAYEAVDAVPHVGLFPNGTARGAALPFTERAGDIALTADSYLEVEQDWHNYDPSRRPIDVSDDGTIAGAEAMYRGLDEQTAAGMGGISMLVPIDDFDASAIVVDDSSLGYAPIGSFDSVSTTLVADASGAAVDPVALVPALSGFGFMSAVPTVVGDVASAPLLGLDDPISSIRVRVEGVESGYTEENIGKVTDVAQQLVDAGFTVTMAAGSSREDVGVFLDGYAFGVTDPSAAQVVGPLGTVEQQWPSLGAAQRVEDAVAGATIGVLALAIGAATLLFGVVQFAGIAPRRRDAALLARIGWRRGRIARRYAAEDGVVLGTLAVAGLGAIALMATQTIGAVHVATPWIVGVALLAAGLMAAAALTASVPALRVAPAPPRALRVGRHGPVPTPRLLARSTVGFGIGQARLHIGHALTVLTAIVLIGLAATGAWTVVQAGIEAAGKTLLADATTVQALGVQALLAAIGIVSGVVLVVLARRLDARVRAGQWLALGAMGWSDRRIWLARAVELVAVAIPAIAIAVAITWFGAPLLGVDESLQLARIAGGASAAALVLLLLLQRTSTKGRA